MDDEETDNRGCGCFLVQTLIILCGFCCTGFML
jgi:hypothetical protein